MTFHASLRDRLTPFLAGALTFLLLTGVVYLLHTQDVRRYQQQAYSQTTQQLSTIRARAESAINKRIAMTAGLRAFVSSHPDITDVQFSRLGAALLNEQSGIRSITLQKNNIVTDVYPRKGNESTLGMDLTKHPQQGPAIRKVIESGKPWLAGPINLVQGGEAFIHRVPVYVLPKDGQGQGPYWGLVSTLVEKKTLVDEITDAIPGDLRIAIQGLDSADHVGRYFIGSADIELMNPLMQDVSLPNGVWKISGVPALGWPVSTPITLPLIIGGEVTAFICALLVFLVIRSQIKYRNACHEALAASRSKSEFLANMSHEIRTPMTAILGYTEVLNDTTTNPAAREAIDVIQRNGSHLLDLINDILDLSKIEACEMTTERIACSTRDMLRDVELVMRNRADQKHLQFHLTIDDDVPCTITTDPTRLKQILLNLLSNAIKFTSKGHVRLKASLKPHTTHPVLQLTISDSGIGMTSEQISRLFKPFTQADSSMTRKYGGTGLGLCISKSLTEILGGSIHVESTIGQGSTFRIELAVQHASESGVSGRHQFKPASVTAPASPSVPAQASSPKCVDDLEIIEKSLTGYHILLAEDGLDNQRLISYVLRKEGADVRIVSNGQEAVDAVTADPVAFDLIILDMQMPVLDGYQAATKLRVLGIELPILALTAHAMSGDEQKCLDAGCDAYATKPIQRSRLIETLQDLLSVVSK